MLLRLIAFIIFLIGGALLGTAWHMYSYTAPDPLPQADAIVVISGSGGDTDPVTDGTRARTERGIELYQAGLAPVIVMSGGPSGRLAEPVANRMAALAIASGVPQDAILIEGRSYSTLQNALFTRALPDLPPDAAILLVTERYHLPRAWASFRWGGFRTITLVGADDGPVEVTSGLLSEGIKWPANVLRALIASAAELAGVPPETIEPFLK